METKKELIYPAMLQILKDCTSIGKGRKNVQQGYNFRGIDDVYNELHDDFAKAGVFIMQEVVEALREQRETKSGTAMTYTFLKMKFRFFAEDGSFVESVGVGEGNDIGDKSTNKAQSSALKYALLQAFLIPTEDKKDVENDSDELKPKTIDYKAVEKELKACKSREDFLAIVSRSPGWQSDAKMESLFAETGKRFPKVPVQE